MWRLIAAQGPDLYVKHGASRFAQDVTDEHARLAWLADRWPVPQISEFVRNEDQAWLVTMALPGRTAENVFDEQPEQRSRLARAIGEVLAQLHATPIVGCAFDATLDLRLAAARRNIDAGLVDKDDFDPEREGWTAEQVWTALANELPLPLDQVVTHGDFSLGNLLVENDKVSGLIDVGRAGVADPYQALAIMWNCLRDYGEGVTNEFWRGYGLAKPDPARLSVHLLLDELF